MRSVACVVVLAACGSAIRPPEPDRRLHVETNGTMFRSSVGYRFGVLPEPSTGVVRIDVRYPVGSVDDPPGKQGLAHLVEHLLFDVEIDRGGHKTSINAELGRLALSWNAETGYDFTTYQVMAVPGAVDELVGLEVDRLATGCSGLTPEIVAREREVVLNELRERQGASGAAIERAVFEQIYPAGHPYRAIESVDTVSRLELADVCDFLAGSYRRGEALIVVSGSVTSETVQAAAAHHMGRLRPRSTDARPSLPALQLAHETARVRADVDEPVLFATWALPPTTTREYRMLQLAWADIGHHAEWMGYMFKWGHNASVEILGGPRAPVLAVSIRLADASKVDDAIDAFEKSVVYAKEELGHDKNDRRWQHTFEDHTESLLARWESLGTRNGLFADLVDGDPKLELLVGRVAELSKATPDAVRDIADNWLVVRRARYVLLEPSGVAGPTRAAKYMGGAEARATQVDGALADKPLQLARPGLRINVERYKLSNGLNVVLWAGGGQPIVHGRLVVDSGWAHDPAGAEGVSDMVGASEVLPDALVFSRRYLSTRIDMMIHSLSLRLRSPSYPLSEEAKAAIRARLAMKRAKEMRTYETDLAAAVYGSAHPYARPGMTEDSLEQIHTDLVTDWAREHIVPANSTLIITGQFDVELVKKYIAFYLDQTPSGHDSADVSGTPAVGRRFVVGEQTKPSPTVHLDVLFAGGKLDADYAKRFVLQQIIENKLVALRGKSAITYGFGASFYPRVAGGVWRISGEADAQRAGEAAAMIAHILADMRRDRETFRAEFVLARQKVLEELLVATGDARVIADRLAYIARFDLDDDFYAGLAERVSALTLDDLYRFVQAELPAKNQVFGAFGNLEAVRSALDAARNVQ